MITQLEMPLRKAPAVKDSDLKTLVLILELNEQWFTAAIHWMESQAGKMQERAIAYRRRGHELGKL